MTRADRYGIRRGRQGDAVERSLAAAAHGVVRRPFGTVRAVLALLPFVACASCAVLDDIALERCGNSVLEPGEDCERHDGEACIAAGDANECRWACATDVDCQGRGPWWRCGDGGVCRRASGQFEGSALTLAVGESTTLLTGDFDGDRHFDLVTTSESTLEVHFLRGEESALLRASVASVAAPASPPVVGRFTPEDHDDLAVAYDGVVVLRGGADQRLHPALSAPFTTSLMPVEAVAVTVMEAMPTLRTPAPDDPLVLRERLRGPEVVSLIGLPMGTAGSLTALVSLDTGRYAEQTVGVAGIVLGVTPHDLVPFATAADVIEDPAAPCDELVLAVPSDESKESYRIELHRSCVPDGDGQWRWNSGEFDKAALEDPQGLPIPFPEALPVTMSASPVGPLAKLLVHDLDGDGHLDLLLGSASTVPLACPSDGTSPAELGWVSYGLGNGHFHSSPPGAMDPADADDTLASLDWLCDTPIAVGDLNEDGLVDIVTARAIFRSQAPEPPAEIPPALQDRAFDVELFDRAWSFATVGHFNLDSHLDVVAGSRERPGLDYLNGAGPGGLTRSELSLLRATSAVTFGDFDGDLLLDAAVATGADIEGATHEVFVSFGSAAGPPTAPQSIGTMARVRSMAAAPLDLQGRLDSAAELVAVSEALRPSELDPALLVTEPTVAFFPGRPSRQLVAPHYLMSDGVPGRVDTPRLLSLANLGTRDGAGGTTPTPDAADRLDLAVVATKTDGGDDAGLTVWPVWCNGDAALSSEFATSYTIHDPANPGGELLAPAQWQAILGQWEARPATVPLAASLNLDEDEFDEQLALGSLPAVLAAELGWAGVIVTAKLAPAYDADGIPLPERPIAIYPTREQYSQRFELAVLAPGAVEPAMSACPNGALDADGSTEVIAAGTVHGRALVGDPDADGHRELLALGMEPLASDPTTGQTVLAILRSDGTGQLTALEQSSTSYLVRSFEAETLDPLSGASANVVVCGITAFALLDADEDAAQEIVVLTREAAYLGDLELEGPAIARARRIEGAPGGTAVAAADFDGDGVDDLGIVDMEGMLRFLQGRPANWP